MAISTHREPTVNASVTGVTNCDRSVDFYTQALVFELVSNIIVEGQDYSDLEGVTKAKIRIVTLRLGDELIELMEYLNIEEKTHPQRFAKQVPEIGRPIPSDWKSYDIARVQVELVVNDIEQTVEILRQNGVQFVSS